LKLKPQIFLFKSVRNGDFIETTLQDRGDLIYYLKEKNPFTRIEEHISLFVSINRAAKSNFTRLMGMEPVKYGSVFMYKNGFRVYPFGEEGQDILMIDRRKTTGL
jgi:hypothetical protein